MIFSRQYDFFRVLNGGLGDFEVGVERLFRGL